jgi:two-component system, cell cycle sensor histidine kinase and response regulator CckA
VALFRDPSVSENQPSAQSLSLRGNEVVLLVEDERPVRTLARMLLEQHGYAVLEASDAEEAIHLAQEHNGRIDLLFTDVMMPGQSGPELFATLSATFPGLKVLYMSGYSEEAMKDGRLDLGTCFVRKPFTAAGLMRKVRGALDEGARSS